MVKIQQFTFNPYRENTFVLSDETGEAVIIDPGCYEKHEESQLSDYVHSTGLTVKLLLNTHGHIDHVLGNSFVKENYKVPLWMSKEDIPTLKAVEAYASNFGFHAYRSAEPDAFLSEGDSVKFGDSELKVAFVPGHSVGHIAFYNTEERFCIGGDVLFHQSIGRTDLPGGDFDTLIRSIHQKFFIMPDDMVIYPGHGPETTIGFEKSHNPFCALK